MRTLIRKIKCKILSRSKYKDITGFNIDEPLTPELQAIIDEVGEYEPPVIPEFNPRRTALFTTTTSHSSLHFYNLPLYRLKVRRDCQWLLEHGYTFLVTNYGNAYGMLALEELSKLRKQGYSFKLCCGKVMGERRTLLHDGFKEVCLISSSDLQFGIHEAYLFISQVILNVTAISSEHSLFYSHQKIPRGLLDFYRDLETKMTAKSKGL